ncbi:hypothetical protein CR513_18177, partial [Mucuna pruriens]
MTNPNKKDWSRLLKDALWTHRTAYRTSLGMSPYRIVFGKILRKEFRVSQKVLLFNSRLKLIVGCPNRVHADFDPILAKSRPTSARPNQFQLSF